MKKKHALIFFGIFIIIAVAISAYGIYQSRNSNCVSYYDKDGKKLLYQDCSQ